MYIKVLAFPDSKKEFVEKDGEVYRIWIRQSAERNQANKRILEIVKSLPEAEGRRVKMVNGHKASRKLFEII